MHVSCAGAPEGEAARRAENNHAHCNVIGSSSLGHFFKSASHQNVLVLLSSGG